MIEIKLQFSTLAEAVAFLVSAPPAVTVNLGEDTPPATPTSVAVAAGKRGPGRPPKAAVQESAPPAAAPSVAETPAVASEPEPTPPAPAPAPTPAAPKLQAYAESDVPGRIMKMVEVSKTSGDKSKVEALKMLLADFGVKSAKDLSIEQFAVFRPHFDALDTPAVEESLG